MTSKAKTGSKGSSKSVLTTINERLAAMAEGDFIAPSAEIHEGVTIVGTLPDHLRRLSTLRSQIIDEHNTLGREVTDLLQQVSNAKKHKGGGLRSLAFMLRGGLAAETVESLQQKQLELMHMRQTYEVVNDLFWLELRTAFPEFADKPQIGVYEGWEAGYSKIEGIAMLEEILGDAVLPALAKRFGGKSPSGFPDVFEEIFGDKHRARAMAD